MLKNKLKLFGQNVYVLIVSMIFLFDQYTKLYSEMKLIEVKEIHVFKGLKWFLAYNQGAAFSFLSNAGGWQRIFFIAIGIFLSIYIIYTLKKLLPNEKGLGIGLSLILGGALGNLWDRILYGHVVDFISVYYQDWHWPTFNIADAAISVGGVIYAYFILKENTSAK